VLGGESFAALAEGLQNALSPDQAVAAVIFEVSLYPILATGKQFHQKVKRYDGRAGLRHPSPLRLPRRPKLSTQQHRRAPLLCQQAVGFEPFGKRRTWQAESIKRHGVLPCVGAVIVDRRRAPDARPLIPNVTGERWNFAEQALRRLDDGTPPSADGGSAASVERRARKNWLIAWIGTRQSRSLRRRISHALLPLRRCLTFGLCSRGAFLAGAHGSVIPDKRIGAKSV
jgi:hypothetical protein